MNYNKNPTVSIAMTTYNHARFIEKTIKSILAQDYSNFEIIVADDDSSDNTVKIVQELSEKYPGKIRTLTTDHNMGTVNNWFRCVSACEGEYIIGLAGDDEFLPGILSRQVKIMDSNPDITLCYTDAIVFDVKSNKTLYKLSDKTPSKSGDLKVALEDSIYYSPTIMFRRKFIPKINIFNNIRSGADLAFYKEIIIIAGEKAKIHYIPEALYKYQKHDSNITVTQTSYRTEHIDAIIALQNKYPKYKTFLNPAIYDFCCVGFFKSLKRINFKEAMYFFTTGIEAASYNPLKFFRATFWGLRFFIKTKT